MSFRIWTSALALVLALAAEPTRAALLFVDADAQGNDSGESWEHAFTDLQPALDAATDGDEIWVACATYLPTELRDPADPNSASFIVRSGVSVFGGFVGGETALAQRDPDPNFNGCALGASIIPKAGLPQPYNLVVVNAVDAAVQFDGFSVIGARAVGPDEATQRGAGFHLSRATVSLRNMRFDDLRTIGGGTGLGGAIFADRSQLELEDVRFSNCVAGRGAAVAMESGRLLATRVSASGGSASFGGGAFLVMRSSASAEVVDARIEDNVGNNRGGAISNESSGSLTIRRSTFLGNRVGGEHLGAAVYSGRGNVLIENSVFVGNATLGTNGRGGAISLNNGANATITNSTIAHNQAGTSGSAVFANLGASALIQNSIIFGNLLTNPESPDAGQISLGDEAASASVAFSIVEGGFGGDGNVDADPQFGIAPSPGDGDWRTIADNDFGDVRLSNLSPAIDAGNNFADIDGDGESTLLAADLPLDADRKPRLFDMPDVLDTGVGGPRVVDMGAYETTNRIFVGGFE
ncbi:MAG: right-handed parallel beta-helix repeat-containing protein [Lysobacteraceae bacterium]